MPVIASTAPKHDLKELEMRLIIRLGGIMAACAAIPLADLPLILR